MSESVVGRLRATLGLDSTRFSAGLRQVRGETQQFNTAMAGGLRGLTSAFAGLVGVPLTMGAIAAGARSVVGTLAAIGRQARATGLDVEDLQALTRGLRLATGMGNDQIGAGFETFAEAVGQAANNGGPLVQLFERLGISVRDANGQVRSQRDLLDDVAQAIRRARSDQERLSIAQAAFGESGRRMASALVGGADGLRRMTDEARQAGDVASRESIARAEELERQFAAASARIAALGQQIVVTMVQEYDAMVGAVTTDAAEQAAIDRAGPLLEIAVRARDAESALLEMAIAAQNIGDQELSDELVRIALAMVVAGDEFAAGRISADEFQSSMTTLTGAAETASGAMRNIDGVTMDNATAVIDALKTKLSELGAQAAVTASQVAAATMSPAVEDGSFWDTDEHRFGAGRFAPRTQTIRPRRAPALLGEPERPGAGGGGGGGGNAGFAGAVAEIQQRTRDLLAEAAAMAEVAASGQIMGDATEYARTRAELLGAAIRDGRADTPQLRAEIDLLARSFVTAGGQVEQLTEALRNQRAEGQRGVTVISDLLGAAAQGADVARAAVARLVAEFARVQMLNAVSGLAATGAGGGFLRAVGRMFTAAPSFEGGGYTGFGARLGGLDGRGGFPAMLHPNEVVHDLSRPAAGVSARPAQVVVHVQPSGEFDTRVANTAGVVVQAQGPAVVGRAIASGSADRAMGRFGQRAAVTRR